MCFRPGEVALSWTSVVQWRDVRADATSLFERLDNVGKSDKDAGLSNGELISKET